MSQGLLERFVEARKAGRARRLWRSLGFAALGLVAVQLYVFALFAWLGLRLGTVSCCRARGL